MQIAASIATAAPMAKEVSQASGFPMGLSYAKSSRSRILRASV